MKEIWLVRGKPHWNDREDEFSRNGIIAIGYPNRGDLAGKSIHEIREIFYTEPLSGLPYAYETINLTRVCSTVDTFVNRIQCGHLVLMPNGDDIHVGIIDSEYYHEPSVDNEDEGYPHQRKVKWITVLDRHELSEQFQRSLGFHGTTCNLTKYKQEIDSIIKL